MVSRLTILQFYDKSGVVDRYIPYLLDCLKTVSSKLIVVVNGEITEDGLKLLQSHSDDVVQRQNVGFDAAAWKFILCEYYGWEMVREYDELLLTNDSYYGPFYPISDIFAEMDKKDIDFWGMTAHGKKSDPYGLSQYRYWPKHLQSFFLVIRKRMLHSIDFKDYWDNQELFLTYPELISGNEIVFTKHFADLGYTWDAYVDTTDLDSANNNTNHYAFNQFTLIKRGFPFFKRKNLSMEYSLILTCSDGSDSKKCIDYIRTETDYDVQMIFENATRTYNIYDLYNSLGLNFVLDSNHVSLPPVKSKAVVVIHITYMDLLDTMRCYVLSVPDGIDIIITTNSEDKRDVIQQYFSDISRLKVIVAPKDGRDFSAFLVAAKPYLYDYDFICFTHDKKSAHNAYVSIGSSFQDLILKNVLDSKEYVQNVLNIFERYPEIGFLSVPSPVHAIYYYTVANGWTCNYEGVKELLAEMDIRVSHLKEKPPLAMGTAFWCRRDAIQPLLDFDWSDRFLPEPLRIDCVINHQLERIFPYVAQSRHYLTGIIQTREYAELSNVQLNYMLRNLSSNLFTRYVPEIANFEDFERNLFTKMDIQKSNNRSFISKLIKKPMYEPTLVKVYYFYDSYSEDNCDVVCKFTSKEYKIRYSRIIEEGYSRIRFDPAELTCIVNVKIMIAGVQRPIIHNGFSKNGWTYFNTNDSNMEVLIQPEDVGKKLTITGVIRRKKFD